MSEVLDQASASDMVDLLQNESEDSADTSLYGGGTLIDGADEEETGAVEGGQKRVNVESADITIFEYKRRSDQGRLRLDPDWQRNYVWSGNRPSQFIESLFMGLPIPVIFISITNDSHYEVIDGVQRLTTCFRFLENKFRLSGLEVFKELNGKYFRDLPADLQGRLEDSTITCFQVSSSVSQDMLFTILRGLTPEEFALMKWRSGIVFSEDP